MKSEYTSRDLRRLPGITNDMLRTWAGKKKSNSKRHPVLLDPIDKPGNTRCWIYGRDAVERIWWIRMLQSLGYSNEEIEKILSAPEQNPDKKIWDSLDKKINDLEWEIRNKGIAQQFAETIRAVGKLPDFPHEDGVDDIDIYLRYFPTDPKASKSGYEKGSRSFLKAHGFDKDRIISQSNTPDLLALRDEIMLSIRDLWILQLPADSNQVLSLVDVLYKEIFQKQGFGLDTLHGMGTSLAKPRNLGFAIDRDYGPGFAAFLAEAVFIYCFINRNRESPVRT